MFWLIRKIALLRRALCGDDALRDGRPVSTRRSRCAAVRRRAVFPRRRAGSSFPVRRRRGYWMLLATPWRRCVMGTNHISCFGIWRKGSRRQALRVNRQGDARWNRPARIARRDIGCSGHDASENRSP
jgi:hypothetical protein